MKLNRIDLEQMPIEQLIRLCKWMGIHESSDFKRSNMINWIVWMGYCEEKIKVGWD